LAGQAVVRNVEGDDVTAAFLAGAQATLALAHRVGARTAMLQARSPSCGVGQIYDGTFSRCLIPGDGVAAALLRSAGLRVYRSEDGGQALLSPCKEGLPHGLQWS
jgi:uncharacterized protein YbbK (DUF523 family)